MAIKVKGQIVIDDNQNIISSGIATASNFKTGTTNVHNSGIEVSGINVLGADTPIGSNATIYDNGNATFAGNVTASAFLGDGSYLTGLFSGSYNDLSNKPSLFSGSYNDLSNKPSIPTHTSHLTNNSGYITSSSLPTLTSQLTNNSGYITSADGGNAATLDGIDSSQFLRSDTTDGSTQRIQFSANQTNNWDTIATTGAYQGSIEIFNTGVGNDAFMCFHAGADYAIYFGLDADTNDLSVGGWSMGANKYRVWHAGNDGSGSGLDSDLLDGQQGSFYNQSQFTGSAFTSRNSGNPIAIDSATHNTIGYTNSSSAAGYSDGGLFTAAYSTSWVSQIFSNFRDGHISVRGKNNGTWQSWHKVWDSGNDGSGSGLDADLLDGQQGSYYSNYNNLSNKPFIPTHTSHLTNNSGYITNANGGNAATLDGIDSSQFLRSDADDNTTGKLVIGGTYGNNAYSSVSSTRLLFGGGDSDAQGNYYIGTNLENYGGNYTKLDLRWHTGIRIGAQPGYGGTRIYNNEDLSTLLFSVGRGDGHTRVESGNLYVQGNLAWHQGNDGSGSGLDADLLDGQQGSYYSNYNNLSNRPTLATLGYTGATNANYITNNNQLTNGAGYITRNISGGLHITNSNLTFTTGSINGATNIHCAGSMRAEVYYDRTGSHNHIDLGATGYTYGMVTGGTVASNGYTGRAGVNGSLGNTFNFEWRSDGYAYLWVDNTQVGRIYTVSDYRLKRNVTPLSNGALDRINQINPVEFQWDDFEKDNGDGEGGKTKICTRKEEKSEGFIAHELQAIIPSAVDGEKDDPVVMQSLQLDALLAVAVKAIQELSAKNDALEARIAQLESN